MEGTVDVEGGKVAESDRATYTAMRWKGEESKARRQR